MLLENGFVSHQIPTGHWHLQMILNSCQMLLDNIFLRLSKSTTEVRVFYSEKKIYIVMVTMIKLD